MFFVDSLESLRKDLELIKSRNKKVEIDKAWETSITRKLVVTVLTYFTMCVLMYTIKVEPFYINAIVPTLGFILSTMSLPFIKRIWVTKKYN